LLPISSPCTGEGGGNLLLGQHFFRLAHQDEQQFQLAGGQVQRLAAGPGALGAGVQAQAAEVQFFRLQRVALRVVGAVTAQQGADAGFQLGNSNGLTR
jgi:hypothetical protein